MELLKYDIMTNSEMYEAISKRYAKEIKQLEALGFEFYGDKTDEYNYWYVPGMTYTFNEETQDEGFDINFPGIYDGYENSVWHIEYIKDTEIVNENNFNNFNDLVRFITED